MAGRPRKPTHLKVVANTERPSRVNEAEPKLAAGMPTMPRGLRPAAVAAWRRLAPLLANMGVLTLADGEALAVMCNCAADLQEAREAYAKPFKVERVDKSTGEIIETEIAAGGQPTYVSFGKDGVMLRSRPELTIIADAERRFRGYLSDFGLTPASRSKVKVLDAPKNDPTAGFFG